MTVDLFSSSSIEMSRQSTTVFSSCLSAAFVMVRSTYIQKCWQTFLSFCQFFEGDGRQLHGTYIALLHYYRGTTLLLTVTSSVTCIHISSHGTHHDAAGRHLNGGENKPCLPPRPSFEPGSSSAYTNHPKSQFPFTIILQYHMDCDINREKNSCEYNNIDGMEKEGQHCSSS